MAEIDKTLNQAPQGEELLPEEMEAPIEVEVTDEEEVVEELPSQDNFSENLAEIIEEPTLAQLSNDLRSQYSVDVTSREDGEKSYIKG